MRETLFPTLEETLYLHAKLIERFGGAEGVIDLGLLESALGRPRSGYYKSLSEQAAALLHSLAKNLCFVDGNERVAFALTGVFLHMNGFRLRAHPDEAAEFMLGVAAGGITRLADITAWLEARMLRRSK